MNAQTDRQVRKRILLLLDNLPPDSLALAERFIQFLQEQARQGRPEAAVVGQEEQTTYPTITAPPSSLDKWVGLIREGYAGDALADTESLYDEA